MWTPLDCAAAKGHAKVADILLEFDSPIDPTDKTKVTVYSIPPYFRIPVQLFQAMCKEEDGYLKSHFSTDEAVLYF